MRRASSRERQTHDIDDDITDVLDLVGLTKKAASRAGDLSGGQRQRLGIAQAQIHRPPLLILDEPAAALDPLGRRDVLAVMRTLKESATVFYSTHILDDVQQVSDEVAILKNGHRVVQSSLADLLAGPDDHTFVLTLVGQQDQLIDDLRRQTWITDVGATSRNGRRMVRVRRGRRRGDRTAAPPPPGPAPRRGRRDRLRSAPLGARRGLRRRGRGERTVTLHPSPGGPAGLPCSPAWPTSSGRSRDPGGRHVAGGSRR